MKLFTTLFIFCFLILGCSLEESEYLEDLEFIQLSGEMITKTIYIDNSDSFNFTSDFWYSDESFGNNDTHFRYNIEVNYGDSLFYTVTMDSAFENECIIDTSGVLFPDNLFVNEKTTVDILITLPEENTTSLNISGSLINNLKFDSQIVPPILKINIWHNVSTNAYFPEVIIADNIYISFNNVTSNIKEIICAGTVELYNGYDYANSEAFTVLQKVTGKNCNISGEIFENLNFLSVSEELSITSPFNIEPLVFTYPPKLHMVQKLSNSNQKIPLVDDLSIDFYNSDELSIDFFNENAESLINIDVIEARNSLKVNFFSIINKGGKELIIDSIFAPNIDIYCSGSIIHIKNINADNILNYDIYSGNVKVDYSVVGSSISIGNRSKSTLGNIDFGDIATPNLSINAGYHTNVKVTGTVDLLSLSGDESVLDLKDLICDTASVKLYESEAKVNVNSNLSYEITDDSSFSYNENCLSVNEIINENSTIITY